MLAAGLRVAISIPEHHPDPRGEAERVAHGLAHGLAGIGHRPEVVAGHPQRSSRTVEAGLPVIRNRRPPEGQLLRRGFDGHLTHAPLTYLTLRRGGYDVVQALHVTDGAVAARWSERTGRPAVLSYMGVPTHAHLTNRRMRLKLTLRAARGCAAVVAQSTSAADAFDHWLGVKARVIHPPVDLEAFSPAPEARAEDPTVLVAPGSGWSGDGALGSVVARLRRQRPGTRLVHPPGTVDELRAAYRRAWVVVLPTPGGALAGLPLTESLACGTPVVAPRAGAAPDVVAGDGVGRLFDDGEDDLMKALLEGLDLAQDSGTAAACRGRAELFSRERCAREYERLYRELLER